MSGRFSDVVNWLLALLVVCALFIACIGISFFLTLNISALFLHVGNVWHGYVGSQVMADYRRVLTYLQWWPAGLHFQTLPMSRHAALHFADVKRLVVELQALTLISLLTSGFGIYYAKKNYQLWRLAVLFPRVLGLLLVICLMLYLSFNDSFILMHHLLFHNSYWVFTSRTDPIILLLTPSFFAELFACWSVLSLVASALCWRRIIKLLN